MDLCNEKKFIDLESDILLNYKKKDLVSLVDEEGNVWTKKEKLGEGGYGSVFLFESFNKEYSDLALKFFLDGKDEKELEMISYFKKNFCDNFIKIGGKILKNNQEVVIMEKIDGDLINLDFKKLNLSEKNFFNCFLKFIISSFKCAYEFDKIFTDIKLENVGYKICKSKKINFTLLDYGSFSDLENRDSRSSFFVTRKFYNERLISPETNTCFSLVLVFLLVRLLLVDVERSNKFQDVIFKLQEKRKFDQKKYYENLETSFIEIYHRKLDKSLKNLFKLLKYILENIFEDLDFLVFLNYLKDCFMS